MDILHQLSQCFLCSGLDKSELEAIYKISQVKKLAKGEILFLEGDPAGGFFVLLSGKMRVFKGSSEGKEYTIHQIGPGQLFAEAAIFRGDRFPANCAALQDSTVAFFPKEAFINLIKDSPQISLKIIGSLAGFLREFNRKVEELTLKEVPSRIASFLLEESEKQKSVKIILDIPKAELARRLGAAGETLSRNFRKLKELGVVKVERNRITILDLTRLNSIAEGEKIF
jgi:CRP/FNR family transcriptional regulator, dissimilatory nitrate respiration regulator